MAKIALFPLAALLAGCSFIPGLVGMGSTRWPVQSGTGENPVVSGEPLTVGLGTEAMCGASIIMAGTTLSVKEDQICLTRREFVYTRDQEQVSAPGPMLRGEMLSLQTEQGESGGLELKPAPATFLVRCENGQASRNVWAGERSACVDNTVLKPETKKVTIREILNARWTPVIEWTLTSVAPESTAAQ